MGDQYTAFQGQHYINGQWVSGQGHAFYSINPAESTLLWQGHSANTEEVSKALTSAYEALPRWSMLSIKAREQYLRHFAQQVDSKRQELTQLISLETGKPRWEAHTEVNAVIGKITTSIKAYHERTFEQASTQTSGIQSHIRYKPHGVIAVLGPFNFPAHLSNGHIVPALLAGNTIIYKPSELTPAVAQWIMQQWHDSGLPAGVLNCIQGDVTTAKLLLQQDIQGIYFTGSYKTGLAIHQQFRDRPDIILALEMGGNNPLIIDEISNIPAALHHTLVSTFITAGQRCTCARRLMIPDSAFGDAFLSDYINRCKTIRIDKFTSSPEPFMGPVIRHSHALAHLEAQKQLSALGGKSLLTMSLLVDNTGFLSPGVIDMSPVDNPPDDEIFAPFVQVYRYKNLEHALHLANNTQYGLSAGILTDNAEHYQQFYQTIRAGLINWNRPTTGASSDLPFGGIGHSGNHRPSAYFASDYCAYPIASLEEPKLSLPDSKLPGLDV